MSFRRAWLFVAATLISLAAGGAVDAQDSDAPVLPASPTPRLGLTAPASAPPVTPATAQTVAPYVAPSAVPSAVPSVVPTGPSTGSSIGPSLTAPPLGPVQAAPIDDGWFVSANRPGFYVNVEALFLHRDNRSIDQPIVVNSFSGATVMTTRDLGFNDWASGGKVALGYQFDNGAAIEGVWFGFQDWTATAAAANYGSLSAPGGLGVYSYDYDQANTFRASYNSTLQNFEANWLRPLGPFTLITGFRYLSWNETFDLNAGESYNGGVEHSDYTISTYNNLFGAQVGLRAQGDWRRLHWDTVGKVGLYGNEFWQRTLIQDYGNTYIGEDNWLSHAGVAFVGDIGLNLGYRFTPGTMLKLGYNLIWIDGLALAPNQLDFSVGQNSGTAHNHQGSVFLQGFNAGLEFRW